MLTVRGTKRDRTNRFKIDMRFDILDGDRPIGQLVCNMGGTQAAITVNDKSYTMATTEAAADGPLAELLRQHTEGRAKRGSQPHMG